MKKPRYVYFYRVERKIQEGSTVREEIWSGVAQLMEPITSQDRLDGFRAMLEKSYPDIAPVKVISALTFLHMEDVGQ